MSKLTDVAKQMDGYFDYSLETEGSHTRFNVAKNGDYQSIQSVSDVNPNGSTDCSGYVWLCMRCSGYKVPSTMWATPTMASDGTGSQTYLKEISADEATDGTIVVANVGSGYGGDGHTGILLEKWSGNSTQVINCSGYADTVEIINFGGTFGQVNSNNVITSGSLNGAKVQFFIPSSEESSGGGSGGGENGGGSGNGSNSSTTNAIEIQQVNNYKRHEIEINGLLKRTEKLLLSYVKENLNYQLLSSEFSEISIYDYFGNKYIYDNIYLDYTDKEKIVFMGTVSDTNKVHITLRNYYTMNMSLDNSSDEFVNQYLMQHGLTDNTPRGIMIISSSTNSFMQAHANSIDAQRQSFNENRETMKKQIELNNQNTALSNNQSQYNADFGVTSASINLATTGLSAVGGVIGNLASLNFGGAVSSAISGGLNTMNAYRGYDNAKTNADFTRQGNDLRSQQNALSNLSTKNSFNQSLRSFNASLKDTKNSPDTIVSTGNDITFQSGLKFDYYNVGISTGNKQNIILANNYLNAYGVMVHKFSNDILSDIKQRKKFNYVKTNSIEFLDISINTTDLIVLKAIFQTGVRIWEYTSVLTNSSDFKDTTIINDDR